MTVPRYLSRAIVKVHKTWHDFVMDKDDAMDEHVMALARLRDALERADDRYPWFASLDEEWRGADAEV